MKSLFQTVRHLAMLLTLPLLLTAQNIPVPDIVVMPENAEKKLPSQWEKIPVCHQVKDALKLAEELRAKQPVPAPLRILFREGTYPLSEPMVLRPNLSHLTLQAWPGEEVVMEGGISLTGWEKAMLNGHEVLAAQVPSQAVYKGELTQLFTNGKRAQIATWPKSVVPGLKAEKVLLENPEDPDGLRQGFQPAAGDFSPEWYNPDGISLHLISTWVDFHLKFQYDAEKNAIWFKEKIGPFHARKAETDGRYVWENVREALTEAGEFYYDHPNRRVFYFPREGENAENLRAFVPVRSLLFLAYGTGSNQGEKVTNVVLDGLTFRHGGLGGYAPGEQCSEYRFLGSGRLNNPPLHNAFYLGALPMQSAHSCFSQVGFFLAEECAVRNCVIELGNLYGIGVFSGCRNIAVTGNTIRNMGCGGIVISGENVLKNPNLAGLATEKITVSDNHLHDLGQYFMQGPGILIGIARGNLIEHNLIHDLYYSGISAGWNWGYGATSTGENRIGYNHIYNLGKGALCDMGGIYLLGIQPGTRVYNNLIHDVECRVYGGWGLYTDEGSSHIVLEHNVCYNCSRQGWHQHYGRENMIRENLFAMNKETGLKIAVGKAQQKGYEYPGENYSKDAIVLGNIFLTNGTPFLASSLEDKYEQTSLICDNNWCWDYSGAANGPEGIFALKQNYKRPYTKAQWEARGFDRHTVVADPGFVDPANGDFHYRPDSAAKAAGFYDFTETIDKAGIRKRSRGLYPGHKTE